MVGPHDKAGKTHRAARFAAWLLKTYGEEAENEKGTVDICGHAHVHVWEIDQMTMMWHQVKHDDLCHIFILA